MVIVSQRIHLDFVVRVSFLVFRMWQMKYFHRQERPTSKDEGACFANRAKTFPKAFSIESYLWRELSMVWRRKYFTANFDTRTRTIWRYRSLSESTHPSRYVFFFPLRAKPMPFSISVDDVFIMSVFRVFELYLLTSSFLR